MNTHLLNNIAKCAFNWANEWFQFHYVEAKYKGTQRPANSALLYVAILLTSAPLVLGQEFQCTIEKFDSGELCVFRGVGNAAGAKFTYPADVTKPSQVAFVDGYMKKLPSQFLTLAGPELKILRVENCGLESVTVTSGLEELYAKDNKIEQVIEHQKGSGRSLRMLDLSGNQLSDVSEVTKFQALEELNLSRNKLEPVVDLGKFSGLNKLRMLNLTENDINYLDNTGTVNLESLEDLDLSHNNLITSDLDISIFYPYTKLHTLRLNDNYLSELDYNYFLNIKPLKALRVNGNNFKCKYLDEMLKHLHKNGLETPPGDYHSCPDKTLDEFCCTGPLPKELIPPTRIPPFLARIADEPETRTTTTTEQPNISPPMDVLGCEEGEPEIRSIWIVIGMVGLICTIIISTITWKILKNKGNEYQVPPGNKKPQSQRSDSNVV